MAATACTIHALLDTIPCDCSAVQIACILNTAVGMKDSTAQSWIRSRCVVQCLNAQRRLHVCTHSNTQNTQIEEVEYVKYTPDALVKRVAKKAGLKDIHPHMFRHTFVSLLMSNPDIGVATVAAEAGHAQPSTTLMIYTQQYKKRRESIRNQLSRELYEK